MVLPLIALVFAFSCESSKEQTPAKVLDIHDEITIEDIQKAYTNGAYSIKDLTQFYLDRIENLSLMGLSSMQ